MACGLSELGAVWQDCTRRNEGFPGGMVHALGEGSHWAAGGIPAGGQEELGTAEEQSAPTATMARPIADNKDCSSASQTYPCYWSTVM